MTSSDSAMDLAIEILMTRFMSRYYLDHDEERLDDDDEEWNDEDEEDDEDDEDEDEEDEETETWQV